MTLEEFYQQEPRRAAGGWPALDEQMMRLWNINVTSGDISKIIGRSRVAVCARISRMRQSRVTLPDGSPLRGKQPRDGVHSRSTKPLPGLPQSDEVGLPLVAKASDLAAQTCTHPYHGGYCGRPAIKAGFLCYGHMSESNIFKLTRDPNRVEKRVLIQAMWDEGGRTTAEIARALNTKNSYVRQVVGLRRPRISYGRGWDTDDDALDPRTAAAMGL